ncbi:uncharacterized protein BDZ99DRAFT_395938 [Mytilinidion resinicola]|uniref:Nudix hydrolase domain-containing protein n=1 Tax=Mytilinidion resinicola TaxID=574789 RepID=A0A6A6Y9E9_9PEZI|nr:uncharacterized protein BDZ99DRAFT_395938 [Mytilinidion resinicola]KAF2805441.1 hypothetical protein BDZ99DRAFT_395938 [Mytilinidion resinicola]
MGSRPQIGVAVIILDSQGRVIMGQRQGSHGAGTWALPGGHFDYGESFDSCAKREVLEETGLEIGQVQLLATTNDYMPEAGRHYVTVFMGATIVGENKEPIAMEPEKCAKWQWIQWSEVAQWAKGQAEAEKVSEPWEGKYLFLPIVNLFRQFSDFDLIAAYRL